MSTPSRAARPSGSLVLAGLLAYATVWLLVLALTHRTPPVDNLEQLVWVRSLQWGYYKHPPLATWLLWPLVQLVGLHAELTYALGAVLKMVSLGLLWWLLREMKGPRVAHIGLLAALCITFYNGRLHYYNHNVVLLFISTSCAVVAWQIAITAQRRWWWLMGVLLGLGALTKYQVAVTLLCLIVFVFKLGLWRQGRHVLGMAQAAIIAVLFFMPHLLWLPEHGYAPLRYARALSGGTEWNFLGALAHSLRWLGDQVLNRSLPGVLMLVFVLAPWRPEVRAARAQGAGSDLSSLGEVHSIVRDTVSMTLLLSWGVVPLVVMLLLGLSGVANLQLHWGTPFLLFLLPALMSLWPAKAWDAVPPRRLVVAFCVVQGLLILSSVAYSPYGPSSTRNRYWRSLDVDAFAQAIGPVAREQAAQPLRVVTGQGPVASAMAMSLPERPLVMIDSRLVLSPWISTDDLLRGPVLEIGCHAGQHDWHEVGLGFPGMAWRLWTAQDSEQAIEAAREAESMRRAFEGFQEASSKARSGFGCP